MAVKPEGIAPGEFVIRTVRYNAPRANYRLIRAALVRVQRITSAGFIYLVGDGDKYHGAGFPFRQWRPRSYGISQYRIELLRDTPEARAEYKIEV